MCFFSVQHVQFSHEMELIERTLHDIEYRIATNDKADIISRYKDFLNSIQTICRKPLLNFHPVSYDFPR